MPLSNPSTSDFGLLDNHNLTADVLRDDKSEPLVFGPEDDLLVVSLPLAPLSDHDFTKALQLITSQERERAARFHFEKDQKLYLIAHALLRRLFELAGAGDPLGLQFRPGDHGKPALVGLAGEPGTSAMAQRIQALPVFNISHCDGLVSCAFAKPGAGGAQGAMAVGVDVEYLARRPIDLAIAHRYFRASEEIEILAFAPAEQQRAFLAFWTLKEAVIKADGRGLTLGLDSFFFEVDRATLAPTSLSFEPQLGEEAARWQVLRFCPSPQHLGAVALRQASSAQTNGQGKASGLGRRRHLLLQSFPF